MSLQRIRDAVHGNKPSLLVLWEGDDEEEEDWKMLVQKVGPHEKAVQRCMIQAPPLLHVQKAVATSLLRYRPFAEHVFSAIHTLIINYAPEKWKNIKKELAEAREKATSIHHASEDVSKAPNVRNEAVKEAEELEERTQQLEGELESMKQGLADILLCEPQQIAEHLDKDSEDKDVCVEPTKFANIAEVEKLLDDQVTFELWARNVAFDDAAPSKLKKRLLGIVKKEIKQYINFDGNAIIYMSLHRLLRGLFYQCYIWNGATHGWEGGYNVRQKVIEYGRTQLQAEIKSLDGINLGLIENDFNDFSDDRVIGFCCDRSSFFLGLWKYFDTELQCAVVPFEKWTEGDFRPFLNNLHINVLQVCASDQPNLQKVMLFILDRFISWKEDGNNDVIAFLADNCPWLDDSHIEGHNATLGEGVDVHQVRDFDPYLKASGRVSALRRVQNQLNDNIIAGRGDRRGLGRKPTDSEHARLRLLYNTEGWKETNDRMAEWMFSTFKEAIDDSTELDKKWPTEDRLEKAQKKLPEIRAKMSSWLSNQRRENPTASTTTQMEIETPKVIFRSSMNLDEKLGKISDALFKNARQLPYRFNEKEKIPRYGTLRWLVSKDGPLHNYVTSSSSMSADEIASTLVTYLLEHTRICR